MVREEGATGLSGWNESATESLDGSTPLPEQEYSLLLAGLFVNENEQDDDLQQTDLGADLPRLIPALLDRQFRER